MKSWSLQTASFVLVLACITPNAKAAAIISPSNNSTSSNSSNRVVLAVGVSLNEPITYSEERTQSAQRRSDSYRQNRGRDTPPGSDSDPYGVVVYNSLDQVPTARLLWRASKMQMCFASKAGISRCWAAYVCSHRCEFILLAINSFCLRREPPCKQRPSHPACAQHGRWVRCQKPRKFKRCYARVCFRRRAYSNGPRPMTYEDPMSVSIVRYHRPPPKHSFFLKRS